MKILAVDTTSDRVSLAAGDGVSVWSRCGPARGAHDERLFSETERLLKKSGWRLRDIDALAAASGPGSFTGIRVGMTFVSVLARALDKPAVAVSLLEAEAARAGAVLDQLRADGLGIVIPAAREELYFQVFVPGKGGLRPLREPRWAPPEAWPEVFREDCGGRRILLAGPAAEAAARRLGALRAGIEVWRGPPLRGKDILDVARRKLRAGPGTFAPLYLKPAYYERAGG